MNYKKHFKESISLSTPVVMSQLGHVSVTVADSAMVGLAGTVPLAAAAFAGSTFYAVLLFGIGLSYAITPLVSKALVKGDAAKITSLLKNSVYLYSVISVLLAGLLFVIGLFYKDFGQDVEVAEAAIPYLQLLAISIIPSMVFQVFRQFLEGLSQTKQSMVISLITNVVNVLLNYLLIFGKFGFPELGLVGAGVATVIARVLAAVMIAYYVFKQQTYKKYVEGYKLMPINNADMKDLMRIGLPAGLQLIFEVTAFGVSAIMVGWINKTALAAHQIVLNVSAVTYMIYTGISAAAAIRVGTFFGQEDKVNQRKAGNTSFVLAFASVVVCGVLIYFLRDILPMIYSKDQEVIAIAASVFVIVTFYQLGDGFQVVGLGALRGLTDVKVPTVVTLISYWGIALPAGYYLAFVSDYGIYGVWMGLLLGLSIAGVLHCARFFKITK